ncbi:MAG TPA: peptidoglycan DD-metalloendopeptidase family protein [Longimicrobiaceae bacterium]|nr:peptidoglycan DD-metalloendopeptidase family protein [Longimicrobiaceae bacterium]
MLFLCLLLPAGARAQSPEKQIRASQERLEQIRRERTQLREQMEKMQSRVHSLSSELENLDEQASASAQVLAELNFQLGQRQAQIDQNSRSLADTRARLARSRATLHERLRQIYERGPLHTVQVLVTSESFADLINRYKYLYLIARHDRELVRDVERLREELSARERQLQRSMAELQTVQRDKASEYDQLQALQLQQKRVLSGVQQQQRATRGRLAKLEKDERELTALIDRLERARREAERAAARKASAPNASTLTRADVGKLAWPVGGRILYRFGRDTQPNGTVLRWNGVGIAAPAGQQVRAVEAGTVAMAGPFEGYGPSVVISHGGGYYSLYLYLGELEVQQGDHVAKGAVIGTVGGTSTPEGPHIEFQIRQPGGGAVDPLPWLGARGAQ